MAEVRKDDQGRFLTSGLNERAFGKIMRRIKAMQIKNRPKRTKRALTAALLKTKAAEGLRKLGLKLNGEPYTKEDLKRFEANKAAFQKKYDSKKDGITYAQLVAGSKQVDIARANNQVSDGRGITRASLSSIKYNVIGVRVKASEKSVHQEHSVEIRLEQWADLLLASDADGYEKAVKEACAGRMSIACTCGRHQFWYRYLATIGRFAITPPSEFIFPKEKNPDLSGIACKHILKAATMLQSRAWQRLLVTQMQRQAKYKGHPDDKALHKILTEQEVKESTARNRSTKANQAKAEQQILREYKQYQRAQKLMADKLKKDKALVDKLKSTIRRKRQLENKDKRNQLRLQKERQAKKKLSQELKDSKDIIKLMFSMVKDTYKLNGKTQNDAINDIARKMNLDVKTVREAIK